MRLTRWGWVLLGFSLTIAVIWAGANIWTLLEEQGNSDHLTKIERIVVGLNRARRVREEGGDALQPANAGQQPSPGHEAGHHSSPAMAHPHSPEARSPKPTPAPPKEQQTGKPAGPEVSIPPVEEGLPEKPVEPEASKAPGLIGNPGGTVGGLVCGTTKDASLPVCTE